MSDPDSWQRLNEEYLAAALQWLRLRLLRLTEGSDAVVDGIQQAAVSMQALAEGDAPPAAVLLSRRFGLSPFEEKVLLLCAAMEFDTRIPGLCAQAQDDSRRTYPTFALAMLLFDDPAWDALSPERPLRYWHLVETSRTTDQPLTACPLRADERVVNYVKGLNHIDSRLQPFLYGLEGNPLDAEALPPSQAATAERITRYLTTVGSPPVIQLVGSDAGSIQLVAWQAAASLGLHPYRLPAGMLPVPADELDELLRLWERETVLLPLALYLDVPQTAGESSASPQISSLSRFLARHRGITFVAVRQTLPDLGAPSVTVEVEKPTPQEQFAAWDGVGTLDGQASQLAAQFNMNLSAIRQVMQLAAANGGDVWQTCLAHTRPQLDTLAQRIDARATWDDIVLQEEELTTLRQLAAQVRQRQRVYDEWGFRQRMNRGLGISALFSGESGTGKTMAAEVLANDLCLNLYRIDLSAVVSKYIGETEKNLRRLFDAAEDGGAILFFDEADALFGKRSEVKDSHDRYANIEINYLLQRMEAYGGLAILATNMKSALDPAFMRRLRFVVNFPFPTRTERLLIWKRVFPSDTPVSGMDLDHLSRLSLTGGSIHNVAVNAAFLAAEVGTSVGMPMVLQAARAEFRKIGRPANEADLRWQTSRATAAVP